jgi:hypothetical protein
MVALRETALTGELGSHRWGPEVPVGARLDKNLASYQ